MINFISSRYGHHYAYDIWLVSEHLVTQAWYKSTLALGASLDVFIAGSITYFLKTHQNGIKRYTQIRREDTFTLLNKILTRTDNMINIVVAYTIGSGALTSLADIMVVIVS